MDGTDCFIYAGWTSFGADASPRARARHLESRLEEPTVNVGLYPGDVSGTWNAERPDSELWIVLPDGYLYRSTNDFEMVGDAVEVAGHVGVVGHGAGGHLVESVDRTAEATGTFTCGAVTR